MNTWEIRSLTDLHTLWQQVRDVPMRTEGRTPKQYERHYLGQYLLVLGDHGLLSYPLTVEEGESPDFLLKWASSQTTGLEITRATDEEIQRWMTRGDSSAFLASPFGYGGDELETKFCRLVRNAIEAKIPKLSRFRPALCHDLLIPDDTRMGPGDRRKVLAALSPWTLELRDRTPMLGKMSVIVSVRDTLFDIGGDPRILEYKEPNSPST